jgi:hypothetical protein
MRFLSSISESMGRFIGMRPNALLAIVVLVSVLALAGAGYALRLLVITTSDLRQMSSDLDSVSSNLKQMAVQLTLLQRVDSRLAATNAKLSTTNSLLISTNRKLDGMLAESRAADAKLARMGGDIALMSHKIAGSFLFRGVK